MKLNHNNFHVPKKLKPRQWENSKTRYWICYPERYSLRPYVLLNRPLSKKLCNVLSQYIDVAYSSSLTYHTHITFAQLLPPTMRPECSRLLCNNLSFTQLWKFAALTGDLRGTLTDIWWFFCTGNLTIGGFSSLFRIITLPERSNSYIIYIVKSTGNI